MLIKQYNLTINLDKPTLVNTIIIKKGDHKSRRLFVLIAISGNILGMIVTFDGGISESFKNGHKLEKIENSSYEEVVKKYKHSK